MQRKPIGLTVPYREVGYKEKSTWVGLNQQDVLELLADGYSTEKDFRQAVLLLEAADAKLKEKNAQKK